MIIGALLAFGTWLLGTAISTIVVLAVLYAIWRVYKHIKKTDPVSDILQEIVES